MSEILTPEQVRTLLAGQWLGNPDERRSPVGILCDSHEALRADRDSWRATAEELDDKNVNKALTARHEMREARLKKQVAELQAALDMSRKGQN